MTENIDTPKPNNDGGDNGGNPAGDPKPNHGAGRQPDGGGHPTPIKPEDTRQVPNAYELNLPKNSTLDEGYISEVKAFAKSQKLTNDEAQAILERDSAFKASIIEGQQDELAEQRIEWADEARKDSEIGGDAFQENAAIAKRVVDKFGTPAFKKALIDSGLGNHPEVIRIFQRLGKQMKDDDFIMSGSAPTGKKSMEDVFYPGDSNKK